MSGILSSLGAALARALNLQTAGLSRRERVWARGLLAFGWALLVLGSVLFGALVILGIYVVAACVMLVFALSSVRAVSRPWHARRTLRSEPQ